MVFELHIWGPAFGLPSIDPECIAAVAYFNRIVPHTQWTLVAGYDTSISPQGSFPLLVEGSRKITGFDSIVSYLRNHHSGAYDLDYDLTHQQQTNKTAFLSLFQSIAQPLLDLYLYVSSENYNSTVAPAYTAILPWHLNYIIPPKRRDLARARTAHLGLSSLDVNEASQATLGPGSGTASSEFEAAKRAAGIPTDKQPNVLSMGRGKGLGGLLSSPIYAARFKLDNLSSELLEPLLNFLGKREFLLEGDKPSSLDCLAFGYLALMLYSPTPQAWLMEAIQTKYPRILKYIRRQREDLLGSADVDAAEVWGVANSGKRAASSTLPWGRKQSRSYLSQVATTASEILSNVPLVSTVLQRSTVTQDYHKAPSKAVSTSLPNPRVANTVVALSAAAAAGLAILAVHHRRTPREGELIFWALRPQASFGGFGEAEQFLSVLAGQLPMGASTGNV